MPRRRTTMSSTGSSSLSQSTLTTPRSTLASTASGASSIASIDSSELELHDLVAAFRAHVPIKDRRYHLTIHRAVFVGSEAVQWMLKAGIANTKPDAVAIGLLMQEAGIIEHCARNHQFKDDHLFYRFVADHPRAALRAPPETRLLAPTRFLSPQPTNPPRLPARLLPPRAPYDTAPHAPAPYPLTRVLRASSDPHDAALLARARPARWRVPESAPGYDLLVLGGGAAGLAAATLAARVGARVALVESRVLGGAGLLSATVPLLALRRAGRLLRTVNHAEYLADRGLAVDAPGGATLDIQRTLSAARMARQRAAAARGADAAALRDLGVHVYFGRGEFASPTSVRVVAEHDDDDDEYDDDDYDGDEDRVRDGDVDEVPFGTPRGSGSGSGARRRTSDRASSVRSARPFADELVLSFRKAVVATGSRAMLPLFSGVDALLADSSPRPATTTTTPTTTATGGVKRARGARWPPVLTGATLVAQPALPPRLAVLGCDGEALAVAQAVARLGSSVTLLARSGRPLRAEEADAGAAVAASLAREGVALRLDVTHFASVARTGRVVGSGHGFQELRLATMEDGRERVYLVDALYAAAPRRPCAAGAALDAAGARLAPRGGGVQVGELLQTANARVFAAGSCVGFGTGPGFGHGGGGGHGESAMSAELGRLAVRNALLLGSEGAHLLSAPLVTLTTPEVARVGATADMLRRAGVPFRTVERRVRDCARAACDGYGLGARDGLPRPCGGLGAGVGRADADDGDEDDGGGGYLRVHVESGDEAGADGNGRILGATLVAHAATADVLAELAVALKQGVSLGALASVIRPFPTLSGLVGQTADAHSRARVTGTVRQLMRGMLRAQR